MSNLNAVEKIVSLAAVFLDVMQHSRALRDIQKTAVREPFEKRRFIIEILFYDPDCCKVLWLSNFIDFFFLRIILQILSN